MARAEHATSRADRTAREKRQGADPGLTQRGRRTRAKLVSAAHDIFLRVAFDEVRITDITGRAGVASGTFYTYFDSKEEVFREVAAQAMSEMSASVRRDPKRQSGQRDAIREIEEATRSYFECVRRNARIARSIEELQRREPGVGAVRRDLLIVGVKRVERWIRSLQEQGICDPSVEPWPTALALHAMNVSVAYDHLVHRDAPDESEALVRATARLWCAAVGLAR